MSTTLVCGLLITGKTWWLIEKVQCRHAAKMVIWNCATFSVWESWILNHWTTEFTKMLCSRCKNKNTHPLYSVESFRVMRQSRGMNIRGHECCMEKRRFRLSAHQRFFSSCVINIWNSRPEETVSAVSVNSFRKRLDKLWTELKFTLDSKDFVKCRILATRWLNWSSKMAHCLSSRMKEEEEYTYARHRYASHWCRNKLDKKAHQLVGQCETRRHSSHSDCRIQYLLSLVPNMFMHYRWPRQQYDTIHLCIA